MAPDDDRSTRDDVLAVMRAVAGRTRDVAGTGMERAGSGVDEAVRALVGRRVDRALRDPSPDVSTDEVVQALRPSSSRSAHRLGSGGARLARRSRVGRAVVGRSPVGLALRFGPDLYDAITSDLRGLDAAVGHLLTRAREQHVDPDPDRVRAVVVQALAGEPIDPDAEADHSALARVWLSDAGKRLVPMGLGRRMKGLTRGRTPEAVAAALAQVDVRRLRRT